MRARSKRKCKSYPDKLRMKTVKLHVEEGMDRDLICSEFGINTYITERSMRIAESPVLQRFIGVIAMDEVKVPCKSLLQKYSKFLPKEKISALVDKVVVLARDNHARTGLEEAVSTDEMFVDACCLEANIHFPVDWLLLRDAVRTLVKSILTIRRHGLLHRIPSPGSFLTQINKCCMDMSSSRRKKDSRKEDGKQRQDIEPVRRRHLCCNKGKGIIRSGIRECPLSW